jgi:penicillin amidase
MVLAGPLQRLVSEPVRGRMSAVSSLPSGTSTLPDSKFYLNLLPGWLTNETFPLRFRKQDIRENAAAVTRFTPAR